MIRIVTKRHQDTRRFKDTGHRFRSDEVDKAFKHAEYMRQTEWMVQIQHEPVFYTGWHEMKTLINPRNALVH